MDTDELQSLAILEHAWDAGNQQNGVHNSDRPKSDCLEYWQKKTKSFHATNEAMLLDHKAGKFEAKERKEILNSFIPIVGSLSGMRILDLGAGIGRYTSYFAEKAGPIGHVVAVDFVQEFVDKNRELHSHFENITFTCADARTLTYDAGSFDLVFSNWLLMYFTDEEIAAFHDKCHQWLRPHGYLFFRESCLTTVGGVPPSSSSPGHYRAPEYYVHAFTDRGHYTLVKQGNVKLYERLYNNPNQRYYLLRKTTQG